jgi:isopenicillin-N epimerase
MNRRTCLVRTGLGLSAGVLGSCLQAQALTNQPSSMLDDWEKVRNQFNLSKDLVHMSSFFMTSHPKPVRDAIEAHRRQLDENPVGYIFDNQGRLEGAVLTAAANYLGVNPTDIALTDSTTMGLALLYNGLTLRQGQEILTTVHDHYSTAVSLQLRATRIGASVRTISLYSNPATATKDEIVQSFVKALLPQTRIVAVTWVHSGTGVKLPIREMADALAKINVGRAEADQALLCVDGVHGFGVEDVQIKDLGCDFFIAGCHKWLFGPRGTGLVWGTPRAWTIANPIIPTFSMDAFFMWMKVNPIKELPPGAVMTPGGFHSFEHRWALDQAFLFHQRIGKARICERIHTLNRQLKEGLAKMGHVKLHTPLSDDLSAGIVCFEVDGLTPNQVVDRLRERRIIASLTPYTTLYARLAPSLVTSPEEVERTLQELTRLRPRFG